MLNIQVAIDGPAGSGKSSISKMIAKRLGFTHIDTGAMFRAITYYALNKNIDLEDESQYDFLDKINIEYIDNKIYLNGQDVSEEIRTKIVTNNVSTVSKIKVVRDMMVHLERKSASRGLVLMDGRDIGSVVLPNADVKIFLTASPEERAKRRLKELEEKGTTTTYEEVLNDIIVRDKKDSTREIAPLTVASDAIVVDTTNLNIDEVCDKIIQIINDKVGKCMSTENKEIMTMEDVTYAKDLRQGQVVTGTVVKVDRDKVYLDFKTFTEGVIYLNHYTLDKNVDSFIGLVNVGDEMTVEITKILSGDENSEILCSRLKLIKEEKYKEIEAMVDTEESFTAKVVKEVADKGYNVSYMGFKFFMPKSQAPKEVKINDEVLVRLIKAEPSHKSGVVSARIIIDETIEANKAAELASISEGDVLTGTVVKILPFACFVKFNHVQGMLRLPEISYTFIEKIEDVLHVGDSVEVKVLSVKNGKISLSRKALLKTPFDLYVEEHKKGETVTGNVVSKLPYGLLIELAPSVRGLLHSTEYSWNPNDNFNNCVVVGDSVEVAISNIDLEKQRISLSRKALIDNPWSRVKARVGEKVECKVTGFDEKGNLEVLALGVDAVIPQKEALLEGQNGKVDDYFAVGDVLEAIIIDVRPKEWLLRLSLRKVAEQQERQQYEKYMNEDTEQESVTLGDMFKDILK